MVLRAELVDIEKLVDTNALVSGHMDVAQQRVGVLIDTAEDFQKDLLAARNSANGGGIIAQPASANLQSLIATLNVTMDGQYLFGGINTGVAPITDYAAGSPSKTADRCCVPRDVRVRAELTVGVEHHRRRHADFPRYDTSRRSSPILPGARTGRRLPIR